MADQEVIVIRQSIGESIVKDIFSFGSLVGTIGVGVWVGSSALQWIAGIIWVLWFIATMAKYAGNNSYKTISQARKRLDELEAQNG